MTHTAWAIVPVKRLSQAKRRLAPVIPGEARRQLVLAMLHEVLAALTGVEALDRVLVVTPDAEVAHAAARSGAAVLSEARSAGLNAAVSAGLAYARANGAREALVIPADVPLATAAELRRVLRRSTDAGSRALLVPSHDGEGTNALLMSPPGVLQPSFGPGSFPRHLGQAVARKLDVQILQPPGLARDIDEPADLDYLMARRQGSGPYAFLGAYLGGSRRRPSDPTRRTEP